MWFRWKTNKKQTTRTREWDCGEFGENGWSGNGFPHGLVAGFESHFPRWALKQVFYDARCCVVCKSICRWMCWVHRLCWCLVWGTRAIVRIALHHDSFCVYIIAGNVNRTKHVVKIHVDWSNTWVRVRCWALIDWGLFVRVLTLRCAVWGQWTFWCE